METGSHQVFLVGRGTDADIRLDHRSISRLHLELILGSGGEIHIADRSSRNGTSIRVEESWEPVTTRPVVRDDRLRLGDLEVTVRELMGRAPTGQSGQRQPGLPSGKVRRNPETGELVSA